MYLIEYTMNKKYNIKKYLILLPDEDTKSVINAWTVIAKHGKIFNKKKKAKKYIKKHLSKKEAKNCRIVCYRMSHFQ